MEKGEHKMDIIETYTFPQANKTEILNYLYDNDFPYSSTDIDDEDYFLVVKFYDKKEKDEFEYWINENFNY